MKRIVAASRLAEIVGGAANVKIVRLRSMGIKQSAIRNLERSPISEVDECVALSIPRRTVAATCGD
jgi:hypothetical protein